MGRWLFISAVPLVLHGAAACAQITSTLPVSPPKMPPPPLPSVRPVPSSSSEPTPNRQPLTIGLPDAPSAVRLADVTALARTARDADDDPERPPVQPVTPIWDVQTNPGPYTRLLNHRARILNPYQRFLDHDIVVPMTTGDKAFMAATDFIDPGNLVTLTAGSAIYIANNPHTAFGPGMRGFGKNVGYSLSQDATGEFLGTFLIPSVFHQDPRYFRMPRASFRRRLLHAVSHTVITRADNGSTIPNYATLLTYPLTAEISNLYVPGLQRDSRSTTARILTGLAVDPAGALVGEFLPDIARHVQIRILFFQQIINDINLNSGSTP